MKIDYLNVCSDVDYYEKVRSDPDHLDYEYVLANYDKLKMDKRVAYHRLEYITECIFEMITSATYDINVMAKGGLKTVRTAIDFTFDEYGNSKGCYCVKVGVYMFRDYEYYKQLLSDSHKDVLEDIDLVFDQEDHGMLDLPKLQRELIDIAYDRDLGTQYPIGSDEITISEDYFLDNSYNETKTLIVNSIIGSTKSFHDQLQELGVEL